MATGTTVTLSRRRFVIQIVLSAAMLTACQSTPAAAPTAAPSKPAEAKPEQQAAPQPATTQSPAAKPAEKSPATAAPSKAEGGPANPAGPFLAEDSAEWKAVLEAARREGQVTAYGTEPVIRASEQLGSRFEAQYGFKLQTVLTTGDMVARVQAEKDSNHIVASVLSGGSSSMYGVYAEGLLAPLTGLPNGARIHPAGFTFLEIFQSQVWPLYYIPLGLLVNRQLVSEAEQPKSWKDLLDPKWKGKIGMHDPGRSGSGSTFFAGTIEAPGYGEGFHQGLVKQDILRVANAGELESMIARGERQIGLPGNRHAPEGYPGSPLQWLAMSDGLIITDGGVGVVESTPTPNAAKVVLNWLLSPEVQTMIAEGIHDTPSISGIRHPEGYSIDSLNLLPGGGRGNPAEAQALQAKAREIYGR